jgi:glycosyltransferase involved in cell wall biosynthesis
MTRSARDAGQREVLCVSYFFPPLGGVSVPRITSFVRHLPEHGWQPTVIAPRGSAYSLRDPAGLAALPVDLEVIRALSPEPQAARRRVEPLLRRARALAPSRGRRDAGGSAEDAAEVVSGSYGGRLSRLRRRIFFPDDQVGWVPFAARAGVAHARRRRPDAIYSTAFPISSHLVAGAIHRLTGIPWVAEFRDPWVANPIAAELPQMQRNLQKRIERWIVTRAAHTILVTPGLAEMFAARYPTRAERMRIVMNGYDPSELAGVPRPETPADDQVRLVYTGTLERPRETTTFLRGLEAFVDANPEARSRVRVELIGVRSPELEAAAAPFLEPDRLGEIVSFVDFMPRRDALARVAAATAAIVTMGAGPGMALFVSGKLFDAIGLDTPVLAMVPPGDVRGVLDRLDWGIVADPEPASVAAALERVWRGEYRRGTADPAGVFDRRNLTGELAAILDEAVEGT